MNEEVLTASSDGVRWREVGLFVALTFGLSWLLILVLWGTVGYGHPASGVALQLLMLIPAFSAIVLGVFVFRDSPIRPRNLRPAARRFLYLFLGYTLVYAALAIGSMAAPDRVVPLAGVAQVVTLLGLIATVVLRVAGGREAFARAGLAFGRPKYWLLFGLAFILFYAAQALLNYLFRLGHTVDVTPLAQTAGMSADTLMVAAAIQSVLVAPFIALLIAFGEEYGWRGYLQGELVKLGRVKGVLLVGLIWGVWHAPVIAMGHNYPGYPVAGVFLMVAYTVGLAFVLGYAVLLSGSVWLAAFLHAVNNQTYSFLVLLVYAPNDPVFSFGAGIYGLATLAVVVALILRDPLWRKPS